MHGTKLDLFLYNKMPSPSMTRLQIIAQLKKDVLEELRKTRFPSNYSRTNIRQNSPVEAFALGQVNYRGQKSVGGRTKGPSRWNRKFPKLYRLVKKLIAYCHPDFKYTTIQVNKNLMCKPHVDKNNMGDSYIIAFGDFTGGELSIDTQSIPGITSVEENYSNAIGESFNIKNRWKRFDGRQIHWVEPFEGERYSLVFFTHTFKPPVRTSR
jgi:hypothetical protein